jgi:hypothetical protein
MGDFNINFLLPNDEITNMCTTFGIKSKISKVTRVASGTCIDNFITNLEGVFSVTNISIADHLAIKARVKIGTKLKKVRVKHSFRVMKELNWLVFKNGVHNMVIDGNSVEERWQSVSNQVKSLVELSFPIKYSNINHKFTMSQGLLKSRDKKNELLKKFKRGLIRKEVYIEYNKIYRKLIQIEQEKSFKNKMLEAGNCGKKKWKIIKKELLLEKDNNKITKITYNGNVIEEDNQIASTFKDHFETCAAALAENLPPGNDTCNTMAQGQEWSFKKITELDLVKLISSLKNKNSCGPDLLSNRMLKAEKFAFSRILKPLINDSIEVGIFPDCLKIATVIPIFKKGNNDNLNNYRPIALLPVMSKVFEKVINMQLTSIIENGYIDENQFGFRKAHSTEDALMKFADKVQRELAASKHVVSVFVDVSKAFDSCDHDILLRKIKKTGLNNTGMALIGSYLKDRKQIVMVNGICGGEFVINIGVGQGTILGPTFFKIYIMDLHLHTSLFTIKFADDSNFIGSGATKDIVENLVNEELVKISKWFTDNKLTLHPSKSKFLVHSRDKLINIKIGNTNLIRSAYNMQEESVKLLGVEIDENLDWKCQIRAVKKKINKGNYLLWRHGKKLTLAMKRVIYESFVRCHLLYALTVWGGAKDVVLKPLERQLSKIWSKLHNVKMHTLNILESVRICKLKDELLIQESKFVWKWANNKIPSSLKPILEEKPNLNNLRGRRFFVSTAWKNGTISLRIAKRANLSFVSITSAKSKLSLMNKIKKDIISNYKFHCRQRRCFICGNRNR